MLTVLIKKVLKDKSLKNDGDFIYIYRYFSLVISSVFYIFGNYGNSIILKLVVVISISLVSILMNYLYITNKHCKNIIKYLAIIDVIGNVFILMPTGGLSSPYIWYALNTILITINYLNIYYCIFDLAIFLILSSELYSYLIDRKFISIKDIVLTNHNFILAYLLITTAAYLLINLLKRLDVERQNLLNTNEELKKANITINQLLDSTMALYKTMNYISNENDKKQVANIIMDYAKSITKSPSVFFCFLDNSTNFIEVDGCEELKLRIRTIINKSFYNENNHNEITFLNIGDRKFIYSNIGSAQKEYGFIGIEVLDEENKSLMDQYFSQIKFLTEFSALVFERMNLDEITRHLIISEEKNKIAQDIHDGVCQKLFGVSCLVHSIKRKVMQSSVEDILDELDDIKNILINSISELRETVHGMSSNKNGQELFDEDIRNYIRDMSKMTNVNICFENYGEYYNLGIDIKKAIYRIICESVGNSIRHGKCKNICIRLNIFRKRNVLEVIDDGIGFNIVEKLNSKDKGLGLQGIYSLVNKLGGEINIISEAYKGTEVNITLPNGLNLLSKGEAI